MKLAHVLAAVAILGMVGFASAANKGKKDKGDSAGLHGTVVSTDATAKTITIKAKTGDVTVTTDDKTSFTVNGNAGTLADVAAGMMIEVQPATGVATKVVAKTAPVKGGKGGHKGNK
jgi:hypothetical protein